MYLAKQIKLKRKPKAAQKMGQSTLARMHLSRLKQRSFQEYASPPPPVRSVVVGRRSSVWSSFGAAFDLCYDRGLRRYATSLANKKCE